jgi:dipeptidyl-peptidase-3
MVPHQVSYESAPIWCLLQAFFAGQDFTVMEERATKAGISADEWTAFVAYAGGFYGNMSNYHSFG